MKVKGLSLPYATERLLYLNVGIRARMCLLGDLGLSKRTFRYYYFVKIYNLIYPKVDPNSIKHQTIMEVSLKSF